MKMLKDIDSKYWKIKLSSLVSYLIPNTLFIKVQYRLKTHQKLNLKDPKTYNEKIQWLKLYYRDLSLKEYIDKYEVKKYVAKTIGKKYVIPTLGLYNSVEEIDFSNLPSKFIMKLTNGSSFNYITYNKSQDDENKIQSKFNRWIKTDYYSLAREWAYKDVKNRILCEKLLETKDGKEPDDFRIFCFGGKAHYIAVDFDSVVDGKKTTNCTRNIYNTNFEQIEGKIRYDNKKDTTIRKTETLTKMLRLAEKLSKPFPAVRVDFYAFEDELYFGELTFYHASGYQRITPDLLDIQMGSLIKLPIEEKV